MTTIDRILDGVYRIATFDQKVGIGFNQYLIMDDKPTLMHTGSATIFDGVLEALKGVVKPEDLAFAFISHFEADECGSLTRFLELAGGMSAVCPAVTGRQLQGFGLCANPMVKLPGDTLDLGKRRLRFLSYPSEMHLWEGLIAYEETDKVLFTSDLFLRRGLAPEPIVEGQRREFSIIPSESIPSPEARQACQDTIDQLDIRVMALGHGPAVRITG